MTTSNATRIAVLHDEMLCSPDAEQLLDQHTEHMPAWLRDQTLAAASEAASRLEVEAALTGAKFSLIGITTLPGGLRLSLITAYTGWFIGESRTCQHSPNPQRPELIYACAGHPNLVVCTGCLFLITNDSDSEADRTCDACGIIAEAVQPVQVSYGPMIFGAGVCAGCAFHRDQEAA